MMVKRKKTVIAAICMAVASVGFVAEVNASAPPQETQETSAPDLQNFHFLSEWRLLYMGKYDMIDLWKFR